MLIFKNFLRSFKALLYEPIKLTRLQKKYPTCRFYAGVNIDKESVLGNYNVIFENVSITKSTVGDNTFVQKNSIVNYAKIGKFCSIAMNVNIGLAQHTIDHVSSHPAFYLLNTPLIQTFSKDDYFTPFQRIAIGHDVWIGHNALIMGGLSIGTGAVVGGGAVVTKDIPEYAIAAGVPARIIGYRFSKDIILEVIKSKWWNKPDHWLRENYLLFSDPSRFIENVRNHHEE